MAAQRPWESAVVNCWELLEQDSMSQTMSPLLVLIVSDSDLLRGSEQRESGIPRIHPREDSKQWLAVRVDLMLSEVMWTNIKSFMSSNKCSVKTCLCMSIEADPLREE